MNTNIGKGNLKAVSDKGIKGKEIKRTSHWLFSRRGPAILDSVFRIGDKSLARVKQYIKKGQVVADLGCGWGHYSFALSDIVGQDGKVYAVDLAQKCVMAISKKTGKAGQGNITTYNTSASDLHLICDDSVDFVFANGLLCSMAVDRQSALTEMERILKHTGYAYLSLGAVPPFGYVDKIEWGNILDRFTLIEGGDYKERWAIVSLKKDIKLE